jgi:hypothetical protein
MQRDGKKIAGKTATRVGTVRNNQFIKIEINQ